jgi:hypothetical protein
MDRSRSSKQSTVSMIEFLVDLSFLLRLNYSESGLIFFLHTSKSHNNLHQKIPDFFETFKCHFRLFFKMGSM